MISGIGRRPEPSSTPPATGRDGQDDRRTDQAGKRRSRPDGLTADQQRMVAELQARDAEVRAHEAAHKAVGGALAGGVSYSYQTGPDGRRYAVGGEVSIDTGAEGDPQATISKMRRVAAAALAPAQPSAQDRAIAAQANASAAAAQRQLGEQRRADLNARYGASPPETGSSVDLTA